MRSDTKALFTIFAWGFGVAVVAMAVFAAGAFKLLTIETAVFLGIGVIVVGGLLVGRRFGPGLRPKAPRDDERD